MKRIKRYSEIKEETINIDKIIENKISEIDVKGILRLMIEEELSISNLNKIVLKLYSFNKYVSIDVKDIEEILELSLRQGVDVNLIDSEGYSLLVNSLFISEEAIKIVLRRNPDLTYSNSSDVDIFEYVSDFETKYGEKLKKCLEEINPINYQRFEREKKANKFNL